MLKSFINAKTGEKIVFSPEMPLTREAIEETVGMKIKGEVSLSIRDEPKAVVETPAEITTTTKRTTKKKGKDLDTTTE